MPPLLQTPKHTQTQEREFVGSGQEREKESAKVYKIKVKVGWGNQTLQQSLLQSIKKTQKAIACVFIRFIFFIIIITWSLYPFQDLSSSLHSSFP